MIVLYTIDFINMPLDIYSHTYKYNPFVIYYYLDSKIFL